MSHNSTWGINTHQVCDHPSDQIVIWSHSYCQDRVFMSLLFLTSSQQLLTPFIKLEPFFPLRHFGNHYGATFIFSLNYSSPHHILLSTQLPIGMGTKIIFCPITCLERILNQNMSYDPFFRALLILSSDKIMAWIMLYVFKKYLQVSKD